MSHPVLVRTLRGLEPLAAEELRRFVPLPTIDFGHRELRCAVPTLAPFLLTLGLADDAFLVLRDGRPLGPHRADLRAIRRLDADLDGAAALLRRLRPVAGRTFAVTASFLGRRRYSRFELEDELAAALAEATGWARRPRDAALSLRLHLTAERTTLAARLASAPLHRRPYRIASRPGALRPPLARAFAVLAAPVPVEQLLDPCCGTGTIPLEAELAGLAGRTAGADLDADALRAARANAAAAGVRLDLHRADAAALPLPDAAVDAVATNPPWGERVRAAGRLRHGLAPFWDEAVRVTRPGSRIVVLLPSGTAGPPGIVDRIPVRVSGAPVEIAVAVR